MRRIYFKLLICIIFVAFIKLTASELILTPSNENKILGRYTGGEITEFDVFGLPSVNKIRKKISSKERFEKIENYIFNRLLQIEGDNPNVKNSEEYKKLFKDLIKRNEVDFLKDHLINEKFMKMDVIKDHCLKNNIDIESISNADRENIINDIRKEKKKEISQFIKEQLDNYRSKYNIKYFDENFEYLSGLKIKNKEQYKNLLMDFGLDKSLVEFEGMVSKVKDIYNQVDDIKPYQLKSLSKEKVLRSLTEGKILNKILIKEAESLGIDKNEIVISRTEDQLKTFVGRKYKEIIFSDGNFVPTKKEMIDYYIDHKDDTALYSKRKMWVIEIFKSYDNKDDIEENNKINVAIKMENIRQKILNGESFEKFAKFNHRPFADNGVLGFIFETDDAMIGKTAAGMNVGDISELIIQEKAISLIKVTEVFEPKLYKFEYVEEIIKRILIDSKKEDYSVELKDELFRKYKVNILEKNETEKK